MDHINFPYRASSHLALLHVVAESGAWARQNLDVDYQQKISRDSAHKDVISGAVEFVGGNHVSTYANRARGDTWTYIGQTVNVLNHRLVVRADAGIDGMADLRHRKFVTAGSHPSLNDWLYLKQRGLDSDRDEIDIVKRGRFSPELAKKSLWELVRDGEADACLMSSPKSDIAAKAGMKVIDVDPMPMIHFTTLSTCQAFVEKHPDIVERFLKGLLEGIAFFKTRKRESIKIMKERHTSEGVLDDEMAESLYAELAQVLEPKLYPSMAAIANVYEEALRQDKDAAKINPLALWDLHFVRKLDDSGFIKRLYGNAAS